MRTVYLSCGRIIIEAIEAKSLLTDNLSVSNDLASMLHMTQLKYTECTGIFHSKY